MARTALSDYGGDSMNSREIFATFSYPNGCLKNRFNIRDQQALQLVEFTLASHQMLFLFYKDYRISSLNDLSRINRFLFADLYDWAGQVRENYDLHKRTGGFDFYAQPAATIPTAWRYIDGKLIKPLLETKRPSLGQYVEALDNINTLHPYREGNGRTTKAFLQLIARQKGQYLRFPADQMGLIAAMNRADYAGMEKEIRLYRLDERLTKQDQETDYYFDDRQQLIGQEKFTSLTDYRTVKDAILFNVYEGWHPGERDVWNIVDLYLKLNGKG